MEGHGTGSSATSLPAACAPSHAMDMPQMGAMEMGGMTGHQRAMMEGMMQTHDPMMQGMMAEDPDVAFACAMIPHHQGAIAMAEAQIEFGADEQMRELAETIIEAQKREIDELTSWLEEQPQ